VGLIQHSAGREWTPSEIELVGAVAGMLGARWEREQAVDRLEEAIAQRDRSLRLQSALTDASRTLLEDDSEEAFAQALQTIAEAADAAIAHIDACIDDPELGPATKTIAYYSRPGSPDPEFRGTVPWTTFPLARAELSRGRPYLVEDVDQLPAPERAGYLRGPVPVLSHLAFPVVIDGRMVAVVAVGDLRPRRWTVGELKMVGTVSRLVAGHQQRNRAHQALEDLVRAKDRFIASVSHELRTPMAVVMGLSSELATRRAEFGEHEVEEFIDLIARQSREVAAIIEDLLVSARASETRLTVHPEIFRLDDEVRRVVADLPTEYTWRIASLDLPATSVYADPMRVRQIIRNLVVNSHRYGGDNVYLALTRLGEEVCMTVADDGPGVPEKRREEIFQPYATINDLPGRTASIGLGLTVSRQLARLMGGDVTYTCSGYSTFELRLPAAAQVEFDAAHRLSTLGAELPKKTA
jgi:signal transduction histidine kinase